MRDPARIDSFLEELARIWKQVPDQRFGQFIINLQSDRGTEAWFLEEEEWLTLLRRFDQERPRVEFKSD